MSQDPNPFARLEELRARYTEQLGGKLAALAALLDQASAGDPELLREALHAAHQLHGTAATFGHHQVSEEMATIESLLKRVLDGGLSASQCWGQIERAFSAVRAEAPVNKAPTSNSKSAQLPTILLLDSDASMLEHALTLNERDLIDLRAASTVEEALEISRTVQVDAALIDTRLADGGSGYDVARKLRLSAKQDLPLAFTSLDDSTEIRVAAVHAGASLFLKKPLSAEAFTDAVYQLTAMRSDSKDRVLIVDDDDDFASYVAALLGVHGIASHHISEPVEILEALERVEPQLLMLDVNMPGMSGFDACKLVRSTPRWRQLPILFITAEASIDGRIRCFEAGADDYLLKPVVDRELIVRVTMRLERDRLQRYRAERDHLTRLLLRPAFAQAVESRLAEADRQGVPVSLVLLDVDHFKQVNDTQGHQVGDLVLSTLGHLMNCSFRGSDLRGRWGGEEFALALYGVDAERASLVTERLLEEFQQIKFDGKDGETFSCAFSAGVSTYPANGRRLSQLIRTADAGLYQAKHEGRSRVVTQGEEPE